MLIFSRIVDGSNLFNCYNLIMEFKHSYKNYYVLLVSVAVLAASISLAGFAPPKISQEIISSPQNEVPSEFFPPTLITLANTPFVILFVTQIILIIISSLSFVRFTKSEISVKQKYILLIALLTIVYLSSVFSYLLVP